MSRSTGYVVVLSEKTTSAIMPVHEVVNLMSGRVTEAQNWRTNIQSPLQYLVDSDPVLRFTMDQSRAQIFVTAGLAQAAIDRIPEVLRPGHLSVQPVD